VAHAEDVTFIVPGSKDPRSVQFFDPAIQIIEKDQTIVFVNPDSEKHRLVVKSDNDSEQVFDTGVLESSNFVAYAFSEYGTYSLECTIYPHMKSKITVTDDIATFSKSIPEHNLDVQLSRSPANPGVDETAFFKLIFIDKASGKNHAHIDYTLAFDDSSGQRVDGMGGHTVDGAEYGEFSFSEEATFTPRVTVSGINFIPVSPATVEFTAIVTPEFPAIVVTVIMAVFIGSLALYGRKIGRRINDYSP
jgi:plastocyanin